MACLLSDHTSNPLQAPTSDFLNNQYNKRLSKANRQCSTSSDDELGIWQEQEQYQEHIRQVVGPAEIVTPKAGPGRRIRQIPLNLKMEEMDDEKSDDELALVPYDPETTTTIDPRKEFGIGEGSSYAKEEEFCYYGEEENPLYVDEPEEFYEDNEDDLAEYRRASRDEDMDGDEIDEYGPMSPLTPVSSPGLPSPFSSPQSSRPPSPDESKTLLAKPEDEQAEIKREMETLYNTVPQLREQYSLVDRLGTGTFSSVYKAIDHLYDEWDNSPWLGNHPPESTAYYQSAGPGYKGRGGRGPRQRHAPSLDALDSLTDVDVDMDGQGRDTEDILAESNLRRYLPKDSRIYVAIKRIYNTSSPERIRNELAILKTCRDCRHVAQVITAYRFRDQVVIVMPYQRNMDFREYFHHLHPEGVKSYFRCMLRALRDIHTRGIIHRDVKPANFLYDPFTGIGTLCDFGLASYMENVATAGACLHHPSSADFPHGCYLRMEDEVIEQVKVSQRDARLKTTTAPEKVGYPENDPRPVSKANRAGTRGFRAPEVLFKCQSQTGAVDIWSVGVIFLSFLVGKFPLFNSNDDIEALMEIVAIVGRKRAERAATLHGRTFATNVPDITHHGITWTEFVEKLNPGLMSPRKYDMRYYPHNMKHRDGYTAPSPEALTRETSAPVAPPTSSSPPPLNSDLPTSNSKSSAYASDRYLNPPSLERHTKDMAQALELLEKLLHTESTKRVIPKDALGHGFLKEHGELDDDDFVPHLPDGGVCRELHHYNEATGEWWVEVWRKVDDLLVGDEDEGLVGSSGGGGADRGFVDLDEDAVDDDVDEVGVEMDSDEEGVLWAKDIVRCLPGQGVAIGRRPCEFHTGPPYKFDPPRMSGT